MPAVRKVLFTAKSPWPWQRQIPDQARWGDCHFYFADTQPVYDAWVVFENVPMEEMQANCSRTLLVTGEPPSQKRYPKGFLGQFSSVISCAPLSHPEVIVQQQSLRWFVGVDLSGPTPVARMDFADLARPVAGKTKAISLISSAKSFSRGHRRRLSLVRSLKEHFGDRLDVFGHGFQAIPDKWEALHPYRCTLVIENCVQPHYWSEKLGDALLAECLPIYCGCPNVGEYFPASAMRTVDRDRPDGVIAAVEECLSPECYETALPAIRQAKKKLMYEYNVFEQVARWLEAAEPREPRWTSLRNEASFIRWPRLDKKLRKIRRLFSG
ncbi:MAG: hypothetical protein H0W72_06915 [Planctomycetes bacterium]|nr:hypothetical protein [Planctomycetota bacterium]